MQLVIVEYPAKSKTIDKYLGGDYKVVSSYSIQVTDGLFNGQFWVKQDTHIFRNGQHEMKLEFYSGNPAIRDPFCDTRGSAN